MPTHPEARRRVAGAISSDRAAPAREGPNLSGSTERWLAPATDALTKGPAYVHLEGSLTRASNRGHLLLDAAPRLEGAPERSQRFQFERGRRPATLLGRTKCSPFRDFRTSPEIIRLATMLHVRFPLSLRNAESLLHERGIEVSHEAQRFQW
jgi:hypothetical protein